MHRHKNSDMKQQNEWVDIAEAALLTGKSDSTLRRAIPELEREGYAKRVPIGSKGGAKVLFSRAYLLRRYGSKEPERLREAQNKAQDGTTVAGMVEILEKQLEAKDRQITALQRDGEAKSRQLEEAQRQAVEIIENLRQAQALNAALQTKILSIGERSEASPMPTHSGQWYYVAVSVLASLVVGLVVWLVLAWVGTA